MRVSDFAKALAPSSSIPLLLRSRCVRVLEFARAPMTLVFVAV